MPALVRGVVAALPDLALAAFFLAVWLDPFQFGEGMVRTLLLVMILEFMIVHASGFMGVVIFGRSTGCRLSSSIPRLGRAPDCSSGASGP